MFWQDMWPTLFYTLRQEKWWQWPFLDLIDNLLQQTQVLLRCSTGQRIWLRARSSGEINMTVSFWIFVKASLLMNFDRIIQHVWEDSLMLSSWRCKTLHAIKKVWKLAISNQNLMYLQKVWTIPVMSSVFFNLCIQKVSSCISLV